MNLSPVVLQKFGVGTQSVSIEPPVRPPLETSADLCIDQNEKFPIGISLMITFGTSVVLWALIAVCIWLALN